MRSRLDRLAIAAVAFVLCCVMSAASAQQRGVCLVAEIPGHLTLAGDLAQSGGKVRICYEGVYVPGQGIHIVEVNGKKRILFSRVGQAEVSTRLPVVVFERSRSGKVRLAGYSVPGHGESVTHLFYDAREEPVPSAIAAARLLRNEHVLVALQRSE